MPRRIIVVGIPRKNISIVTAGCLTGIDLSCTSVTDQSCSNYVLSYVLYRCLRSSLS